MLYGTLKTKSSETFKGSSTKPEVFWHHLQKFSISPKNKNDRPKGKISLLEQFLFHRKYTYAHMSVKH